MEELEMQKLEMNVTLASIVSTSDHTPFFLWNI